MLQLSDGRRFFVATAGGATSGAIKVLVEDQSFEKDLAYWQVARLVSLDLVVKDAATMAVAFAYLNPDFKARRAIFTVAAQDATALMTFLSKSFD